MHVRLLRDEDLDETIAVWHETRKKTHTSIGVEAERGLTLDDSQRIFRENIAPRCQLWVAEKGGQVVGFLAILNSYVDRMYVKPGDQGCGVGTALLEMARKLSPEGLELHTHRENRRARADARPLEGLTLAGYRELEQRLENSTPGWAVELRPPLSALPEISVAEDGLDSANAGRVALIAWAAQRSGVRVSLSGSEAALQAVTGALGDDTRLFDTRTEGEGNTVVADWSVATE